MLIRLAAPEDIAVLKALYYDTITTIASRDYNATQIAAWASTADNTDSLARRIAEQYFYVALTEAAEDAVGRTTGSPALRSVVTGFASLESGEDGWGYLDLLYVHKDFQRQGVATRLVGRLLEIAGKLDFLGVDVEASITARPFFEKHNFRMTAEQTVLVKGVALINYKMRLDLTGREI